ncbi:galectin-9-like [Octopus sinensis]|uniref:Galectin n=1 Tax=Octopus sinensis TaxID=2607531 RepID=A0A6P7SX60_9MOLL|nr:galectin-9-like [Octopus sinensis]
MYKQPTCYEPVFVSKPCIPYVGEIPGGLQCGTLITIQGQTSHHHSRFSINFCSSPISEPLPDTILHIDLRFNDCCIVRNSLYWGSWGSEERDGCFPLRKGELFEAVILVENNGFKIAFNGKHFAYFARRYPLCLGKFLIIKGHVHINFIRIGKNEPLPTPSIPPSYPVPKCLQYPKVPLSVSLPNTYNRHILVTGYPSSQYPERFSINLKFGCETPFHLDVRFHYGASRNTVVCNSYIFGAWGNEEVHSHFPFSCGNSFEIKIIETPHMYKVLVNGHHYLNFNHRFPAYNQVNKLEIEGDVVLTLVEFK